MCVYILLRYNISKDVLYLSFLCVGVVCKGGVLPRVIVIPYYYCGFVSGYTTTANFILINIV